MTKTEKVLAQLKFDLGQYSINQNNVVKAAEAREAIEVIEVLLDAVNDVIDYQRREARDKYGDAEKAESWACVKRLRAALSQSPTGEQG